MNWQPDPIFEQLALQAPIINLPDANQFPGRNEILHEYALLTNNNNPNIDSSPASIIESAQNHEWRTFLLKVGRWGGMIPGILRRPFNNIYWSTYTIDVTEERLVQIETALGDTYSMILNEQPFELVWNRLRELGWTKVILSKCLHFIARAADDEGLLPIAVDNAMSCNWLWPSFQNRIQVINLDWPRPAGINGNEFQHYNRYFTAMVTWAQIQGIDVGEIEIRLFSHWRHNPNVNPFAVFDLA